MKLFSFLRTSQKTTDTVFSGILKGADKLILTEQEKLEYSQKAGELWLKAQEAMRQENSARAVTRRMIAVPAVYIWLGCQLLSVAAGILATLVGLAAKEWIEPLLQISEIATAQAESMDAVVLGIIVFYFGPHVVSALGKKHDK